jgi:DNA-binding transcriptional MocR family regulator
MARRTRCDAGRFGKILPSRSNLDETQGRFISLGHFAGGANAQKLFEAAVHENVAFVPGDCFYAPNGHADLGRRQMRLNFSSATPEQIREGVRRLSIAVKQQLETLQPLAAVRWFELDRLTVPATPCQKAGPATGSVA